MPKFTIQIYKHCDAIKKSKIYWEHVNLCGSIYLH